MSRRSQTRIGAAILTLVAAASLVFVSAGAANATHEERSLQLTRVDGSPVGTLFTDWVMVPGDRVSTTLLAHRKGAGESSLLITLGDSDHGTKRPATPVEEDVIITAEANGLEIHSSAATLMKSDASLDLGRSSDPVVPITVTFELPFSSSNATQQQSMDLMVMVVAADIPVSTPEPTTPTTPATPTTPDSSAAPDGLATVLPFLPDTGASVRDVLIIAALLTTFGLLLLGGRRKSHSSANAG